MPATARSARIASVTPAPARRKTLRALVAVAALTAAFSSVAYELLLATYATFLLGASIFQYSLVFSLMMASMGVGALVAGRLRTHSAEWVTAIELALAVLACAAVPALYSLFALGGPAQLVLLFFVTAMGMGLGMEIPLLNHFEKDNRWLGDILIFDYLGGFVGGLLFPLWLLPHLGFFRLAALLACLNAALGLGFALSFRKRSPLWVVTAVGITALCVCQLYYAEQIRFWMEARYFGITP